MAETTGQERSELPTPRRLDKALEEGQVPRSQELLVAVVVLSGAAGIAWFGGGLGRHALGQMSAMGRLLPAGPMTESDATLLLRSVFQGGVIAILPLLLMVLLPVMLVGGLQARGVLATKPIMPDLSRISPLKGFKRVFGVEGWFTLLKALVKIVVLGAITWGALSAMWPTIAPLLGGEAGGVLMATRSAALRITLLTGVAFLGLSMADYLFASWRHRKQLMMTRQEIVQEHRESEGDPLLKGRMRSLAQQMARRRMLQDVARADVVVVNPTRIAVAIRYDLSAGAAPMVVAIGQRKLAERIRGIAMAAGVPIVQNVPVARALVATCKVGHPIPPALYAAIAEILAFVYRQRGRIPGHLQRSGR